MNVRPKRYMLTEGIRMIYGPGGSDEVRLAIECEVVKPPSMLGRTVYVLLDDADVTTLLLEFRDAAVEARR